MQSVLKEAKRFAKTLSPEKRAAIEKLCSEIDELTKELEALQAKGEVCSFYSKIPFTRFLFLGR